MRISLAIGLTCALLGTAFAAGETELVLKTKLGDEIAGAAAMPSLRIKTAFGEATIAIDMLASADVGDPDFVTTRDGVKLKGKILTDKIVVKVDGKPKSVDLKDIVKIRPRVKTVPIPGEIVDGSVTNGLTYHFRAPKGYDPKKPRDAIVLFHGSNMNSKAYVNTLATAWPKLADDYVVIGVNGEFRVKDSPDDNPAFNYTYVNFVGKSVFKGFPGTDRESPALVSEALTELKKTFNLRRFFVGGHSQGGFLTYSVLMNYPELVAGAFPVSAGVIFQCEPSAYDKDDVRAAQRRVPVAIVHGENDEVVAFSMGSYAYEIFEDGGFPMVKLLTDKSAAHMFGLLPIEKAVRWLESMASDDPAALLTFAEAAWSENDARPAVAAWRRAVELDKAGKEKARAAALAEKIDKAASADAKRFEEAIANDKGGQWIDEFLAYRAKFEQAECAKKAMAAFAALRQAQQKAANERFDAARADFQKEKKADGYRKCQEIVDLYFASDKYRTAKRWLAERK